MAVPVVRPETRTPQEICAAYGSAFVPPDPLDKVAVALNTLDQPPLNARRVSPERGICGWYIWGGEGGGRARTPGFFQTLPVAHLFERCPQVIPFLALAPGWRLQLGETGLEIKPPHALPPPDNVAARRIGSRTSRTPPAKQWVWLSILLHILAVVLFGDTTGGSGTRTGLYRGERPGGPLNVTLNAPAKPDADAPALRSDTRLRSLERRESAPPVAPRSRPVKDTAPAIEPFLPPSTPPKQAEDTPAPAVMPPVIATEVDKPVTNFVVPAAPAVPLAPPEPPAARLPVPLPRLETIVPPKAIDAPGIERDVTLPTALIPRLAPVAPLAPPVEVAPRAKIFVPPRIEPEAVLAPPIELPRAAPLAPPQIEREIARPAELLPSLPPVTPAAAIEAATPITQAPRMAPATPAATERTPEPVRTVTPPTLPSAASPVPALPATSRVTPGSPDTPGAGGDTPGALAPRPSTPAPAAGSVPRIDLDAVRQRAREIGREGSGPRTLLPFNVKPREETRNKEQQAFDKALKRPDCKEAYAGMGLAAVVPLLWDAVSEKGCKW